MNRNHISHNSSIDKSADSGSWFRWSAFLGLVGMILCGGCQSIPSDLMKTFPKESTKYLYEYPIQTGLEWWYQGTAFENDDEESYLTQDTITRVDPLGEGVFIFSLETTNYNNQGPREVRFRIDKEGVRIIPSEADDPIKRFVFNSNPILRFPIRIGLPYIQVDQHALDMGQDLDRDGQNERMDLNFQFTHVRRESVTVPAGTYSDALLTESQGIVEIQLSSTKKVVIVVVNGKSWQTKEAGCIKSEYRSESFLSLAQMGGNKVQKYQLELLGVRANPQLE